MQQVGFKKMNWAPKASAWDEHVKRRARQRKMIREFVRQQEALAHAFQSAAHRQLTGRVENVARTATDRIIAESRKQLEAKMDQFNRSVENMKLDKLA